MQNIKVQYTETGVIMWLNSKPYYFPTEAEAWEWLEENQKEKSG